MLYVFNPNSVFYLFNLLTYYVENENKKTVFLLSQSVITFLTSMLGSMLGSMNKRIFTVSVQICMNK